MRAIIITPFTFTTTCIVARWNERIVNAKIAQIDFDENFQQAQHCRLFWQNSSSTTQRTSTIAYNDISFQELISANYEG